MIYKRVLIPLLGAFVVLLTLIYVTAKLISPAQIRFIGDEVTELSTVNLAYTEYDNTFSTELATLIKTSRACQSSLECTAISLSGFYECQVAINKAKVQLIKEKVSGKIASKQRCLINERLESLCIENQCVLTHVPEYKDLNHRVGM